MAEHAHHGHAHGHDGTHGHSGTGLAETLDLDAEIVGAYLDTATGWIRESLIEDPRTIVDVGAGTGSGSIALARRFPAAEVVALERSAEMLERLEGAAVEWTGRLRVVRADLDVAWPDVAAADLAWASSSLHEVADPDRVLADVHRALNPGGVLLVVEMDELPRFLPNDIGTGRAGLESRLHETVAGLGWNSFPDWRPHLQRAGFEVVEQRALPVEVNPAPPGTVRYAHSFLSRIREAVDGSLAADDLDTLDRLLADEAPHGLSHRTDLTARGGRTAWAARRP